MEPREIVRRAIEFERPPRLPFFQNVMPDVPDDACEIREMDRAQAGYFFDNPTWDDWGCRWEHAENHPNMGQVVEHPLADASALETYWPPDPRNPYYFDRIGPLLNQAGDRYLVITSHFNLIERLHMLRGFAETMMDFYLEPARIERVLDMIVEFKVTQFAELDRRFGDRVDGVFLSDDWGTQQGTFVGLDLFERFFARRYAKLFDAIHGYGWHVILHSCGRINDFVPRFIELGVDVLNMQQPRAYGLVEFGEAFKGKVCFLTTADIQATLPTGDEAAIREEVRLLVEHWGTPAGGFIVFNYGDPRALGVADEATEIMFDEFVRRMKLS